MTEQPLRTDESIRIAAADTAPTVDTDGNVLPIGRELIRDNGGRYYWTGSAWKPVTELQKLCQVADLLVEIRGLLT